MALVPGNNRYQSNLKKSKQVSAFKGGVTGSGTVDWKDTKAPSIGKTDTSGMKMMDTSAGRPVQKPARDVRPAAFLEPGGSGNIKSGTTKVGSGDKTHYVDVPEANKDRGKVSTPNSSASSATTSEDAGSSRPAPAQAKKNLASALKNAGKDTSANTDTSGGSGGKLSLNDFMALAAASGKSNAYRRGYQMYKNYKATGKLPARRVSPD